MRRAFVFGCIAIASACVDLSGLNSGSPYAGSDASAPVDASIADAVGPALDGSLPVDVDPDGRSQEAGTVDASPVDASGGCCDCDMDSYVVDAASSCVHDAGIDCDDSIAALNPVAGFTQNPSWPITSHTPPFDWNCDGIVTKQLNHDLKCAGQLGVGCNGEGFQNDPPCGAEGDYFVCRNVGTTCTPQIVEVRRQACR